MSDLVPMRTPVSVRALPLGKAGIRLECSHYTVVDFAVTRRRFDGVVSLTACWRCMENEQENSHE